MHHDSVLTSTHNLENAYSLCLSNTCMSRAACDVTLHIGNTRMWGKAVILSQVHIGFRTTIPPSPTTRHTTTTCHRSTTADGRGT
jgi:hypothetical protein